MDLNEQFAGITGDFQKFRAVVDAQRSGPGDPYLKEQLDRITAQLDRAFADAQKAFPNMMKEIDGTLAAAQRTVDETQQKVDEVKQKLGEMPTAPAPPPPREAVVASEGAPLRTELLECFSLPKKGPREAEDKDVWEDWSHFDDNGGTSGS